MNSSSMKRRNTSKKAVAIRHVAFEDLGSFGATLWKLGYSISYREAGRDELASPEVLAASLLVVLGGPIGACQEDIYPFIGDELRILEKRLEAGLPTIGICLGAQLMARALGAQVYAASGPEIGWKPLVLTDAGRNSPLRHLAPELTKVLHWHGDTFDIPDGAALLASSDIVINQAFSWGNRALALQFHPEATAMRLEQWFIGHALEISQAQDVSVALLRAESAQFAEALEPRAGAMIEEWLACADRSTYMGCNL